MKRIIFALITLGLLLGFTGCADSTKNTRADFVVIENYRTAEASEESDPVLNAVQSYCEETKSEYSVFTITDNTPFKLRGALDLAKNAECRFVIVPDEFRDTVQSVCADYPSIQFVLFDTYYEDLRDDVYPNLHALDFNYYEAGYLAGRAVPLNRYDSAGILDRFYDRRSAMFAQGFVKGAEDTMQDSGKNFSVNYFNVHESSDNKINQIIYQTIVTSSDAILYNGEYLQHLIDQYAMRTGMKYIGLGTNYREITPFFMELDYPALFRAFMMDYEAGNTSGVNYVRGFKEDVIKVTKGTALSPEASAQIDETIEEFIAGNIGIPETPVPYSELSSEVLTVTVQE